MQQNYSPANNVLGTYSREEKIFFFTIMFQAPYIKLMKMENSFTYLWMGLPKQ